MGLVVLICTVVAELLAKSRIGRAINLGFAVAVIAFGLIVALLLINLMIFTALGI